jgi:hypothetical protein
VAVAAGATPDILDEVVKIMVRERKVRQDYAEELVKGLTK